MVGNQFEGAGREKKIFIVEITNIVAVFWLILRTLVLSNLAEGFVDLGKKYLEISE